MPFGTSGSCLAEEVIVFDLALTFSIETFEILAGRESSQTSRVQISFTKTTVASTPCMALVSSR